MKKALVMIGCSFVGAALANVVSDINRLMVAKKVAPRVGEYLGNQIAEWINEKKIRINIETADVERAE